MGTVNPRNWTCVVPAAGRGTRLGFHLPKVVYPILGQPMITRVVRLLKPYCSSFVLVLAPDGIEPVCSVLESELTEPTLKIAVQPEPTGMADAILLARDLVQTPFTAIVWADQVALRQATIRRTLAEHEEREGAELTFPTIFRRDPYIHISRHPDGRIKEVLQAREGEIHVTEGEGDCGFFAFSSRRLFQILSAARSEGASVGNRTQEFNLLPLIPRFDQREGGVVTFRAEEDEAIGVNTRVDAAFAERVLLTRSEVVG